MAKILVIEDDPELQAVLTTLLSSETHEVTGVSSGEAALEVTEGTAFDLVIADVRMEGMSGLDAIERVTADNREMKSLVITGYASEEDSIRAISLGVDAYLKKPFNLDDFLDAVNRALLDLENERAAQRQRLELTASFQWALTALSRLIEQSPEAPPLSDLSPTVESLCDKLDVVTAVRSAAIVTTLYLGVRDPLNALVLDHAPPFPRAVERALDSLDEWYDGSGHPLGLKGDQIPLETRIAQVSYAAVCEVSSAKAGAWLEENRPGRYDPHLLKLLDSSETKSDRRSRDLELHVQRNHLSIGKTFEESGNFASARQAYFRALGSITNRFAMEASLGLTRLTAREGKSSPQNVRQEALRTLSLAEHVGAAPFGWCGLELALIFHDAGLSEDAEAVLARAELAFTSLKLKVGESAIRLARFALFSEGHATQVTEALERLLRSDFSDRLAPLMLRLLPPLLELPEEGALLSLIGKVVRDYPKEVLETLYARKLTTLGRLRVARVHAQYILPRREALLAYLSSDPDPEVRQALEELKASEAGQIAHPVLRVYSLGPLNVYRGDSRIQETQWRSQKTKYLLAMLAAAGEHPVSEDKILDTFWPGSTRKGRNCLYWSTSTLRQCLSVEGFEVNPILRTGSGLQINPEIPFWHDFALFEKLAESVRSGSTSAYNIEDFLHVLDLYRGPYLEGAYFDWVVQERHRLEVLAIDLLTRFIDWTLQRQRFSNTLDYGLRLLDIDPSKTEAHLAVMQAWLALGKPKAALEHFETAERLLWNEYDMEPSIPMLEYKQRALLALDYR